MPEYIYKTYRVEYAVQVFPVDQYNASMGIIYYEKVFPDWDSAYKHLEIIAPRQGWRRVWKDAPSSYHDAGVLKREVLVSRVDHDE